MSSQPPSVRIEAHFAVVTFRFFLNGSNLVFITKNCYQFFFFTCSHAASVALCPRYGDSSNLGSSMQIRHQNPRSWTTDSVCSSGAMYGSPLDIFCCDPLVNYLTFVQLLCWDFKCLMRLLVLKVADLVILFC